MAAAFRQSSPGWLWEKTLRRSGEAIAYWFQRLDLPDPPELPDWSLPQWLIDLLLLDPWQWMLLLILLALGLGYWLYRLLRPYARRNRRWRLSQGRSPEPATLPGSLDHWLNEAQRHRQAQRYGEACRALYFALLFTFDETQTIPQQASRTDREYLHLSRDFPQASASQLLLETHEQLCFSSVPASDALFQRCWQAFQQLSQQLDQLRTGPDPLSSQLPSQPPSPNRGERP